MRVVLKVCPLLLLGLTGSSCSKWLITFRNNFSAILIKTLQIFAQDLLPDSMEPHGTESEEPRVQIGRILARARQRFYDCPSN